MSSLRYWIWLSELKGVSCKTKHRLLERFASPDGIYFADEGEYKSLEILRPSDIRALLNKDLKAAKLVADICLQEEIRLITIQDVLYPIRLKMIFDAPIILYVRGRLPAIDEEAAIAMVGTRKATPYGLRTAERLAFGAAKGGALIVTGLAEGIDSAAAKGALKAGGKVIGVLGTGVDVVYPPWNSELFRDVLVTGALISEYPPKTKAFPGNFPERNRIISGISVGTLVVEAPKRSGSLITVSRALEQGRDVFAVPANIDAQSFAGSNELLKEGAIPVTQPWDILKEYEYIFPDKISSSEISDAIVRFDAALSETTKDDNISKEPAKKAIDNTKDRKYKEYIRFKETLRSLSEEELAVITAIGENAKNTDEIADSAGLPFQRVMKLISKLELMGYLKQSQNKRFELNIFKTGENQK